MHFKLSLHGLAFFPDLRHQVLLVFEVLGEHVVPQLLVLVIAKLGQICVRLHHLVVVIGSVDQALEQPDRLHEVVVHDGRGAFGAEFKHPSSKSSKNLRQ